MYYILFGPDNGRHMCGTADRLLHDKVSGIPYCKKCGFKTDPFFINPRFRGPKIYDVSYTYDNYAIVSLRFKELCLRFGITGAVFIDLPNDKESFVLKSDEIVQYDWARVGTRFENYCDLCESYGAISGVKPAFLCHKPSRDIAMTDILFGSGNERFPLLVISERLRDLMISERMRGSEFFEAGI